MRSAPVGRNNDTASSGAPVLEERKTEKLLGDWARSAVGTRGHPIQEGILEEVTFQLSQEGQRKSDLAEKQGWWREEGIGRWRRGLGELGGMWGKLTGESEQAKQTQRGLNATPRNFVWNRGALRFVRTPRHDQIHVSLGTRRLIPE